MGVPLQLHCETPLEAAINRKTQLEEVAPAGPTIRAVRRIVFSLIKTDAERCYGIRIYLNSLCVGDTTDAARLGDVRESPGEFTNSGSGVGYCAFGYREPLRKIAVSYGSVHAQSLCCRNEPPTCLRGRAGVREPARLFPVVKLAA